MFMPFDTCSWASEFIERDEMDDGEFLRVLRKEMQRELKKEDLASRYRMDLGVRVTCETYKPDLKKKKGSLKEKHLMDSAVSVLKVAL